MALVADWSFEAGGVIAGDGTDYCPAGPIGGLGSPPHRTADAPRGDRYGQVPGRDVHDARTLTFPVVVRGTGGTRQARMADAMPKLMALNAAWGAAIDSAVEVELGLRLPGFPGADHTLTYYGRPRGVTAAIDGTALGHLPALLDFRCLDPYGYRPPDSYALGAATNPGNVRTDRAVITLTSGGAPTITKTATLEAFSFAQAVPAGTTIDLRTGAVEAAGVDYSTHLAPGPLWFDLDPGLNVLTITGATATIAVQGAWT